jgi:hypothetical protein
MADLNHIIRGNVGLAGDLIELTPDDDATFDPPYRGFLIPAVDNGILEITTLSGEVREFPAATFASGIVHMIPFSRLGEATTATVFGVV